MEEEDLGDDYVESIKFSEDGSLLAAKYWENLELWKTSTCERMWSVPCSPSRWQVYFSPDSLRVLVREGEKIHAHDVRYGDALGEIDSIPYSMHDHVHVVWGEMREKLECWRYWSSFSKNGEYWFTESDRWLWVVEERVARRLIHIPAEYDIKDIKAYSRYVAIGHLGGLLVLDTGRNPEVM